MARASFSKLGSESAVSVESVDSPLGTVGGGTVGGGSLAAARRIARSARATLEGEADRFRFAISERGVLTSGCFIRLPISGCLKAHWIEASS